MSNQNILESYYLQLLRENPENSAQAQGWNSIYTQAKRFEVLTGIADVENCTILDVGCGLGDFYRYLKNNFRKFEYLGLDLLPEMIEKAKFRFPEANFTHLNFLETGAEFDAKFDYVFASGLFAVKTENYAAEHFELIEKMYLSAKKGIGFNMLNKKTHPQDEFFATYLIDEVVKKCSQISNSVVLRDDYLEYDFTVFLYK